MISILKRLDLLFEKFLLSFLYFFLFSSLFFSLLLIFCRLLQIPVVWAEPLVRHLVFLLIFLGGIVATGQRRHIGIDLLKRFLESGTHEGLALGIEIVVGIVSAITCFTLAYFSFEYGLITQTKSPVVVGPLFAYHIYWFMGGTLILMALRFLLSILFVYQKWAIPKELKH